jgi:hypothetical protein
MVVKMSIREICIILKVGGVLVRPMDLKPPITTTITIFTALI